MYAATPASDFICGTLQLAAGMNLHVLSTGRGTPCGLPAYPVIKVATRSELARRWHDLIDVNAGRIADGDCSVEALGREICDPSSRWRVGVAPGPSTGSCRMRWPCSIRLP